VSEFIVAIDGPAGSGKSSVAKGVAQKLGFEYLNTGAMYRAIAFELHSKGLNPNEDSLLRSQLARIRFCQSSSCAKSAYSYSKSDSQRKTHCCGRTRYGNSCVSHCECKNLFNSFSQGTRFQANERTSDERHLLITQGNRR